MTVQTDLSWQDVVHWLALAVVHVVFLVVSRQIFAYFFFIVFLRQYFTFLDLRKELAIKRIKFFHF